MRRGRARTGRSGGLRDDAGYLTVVTAFVVAAVLVITVGVLLVGRAAVAAHSARSAADLAALAGAHALRAGGDPCAVAAAAAGDNRATAAVCTVDGRDVVVRAEVRVVLGVLGARAASAVARAGPV